MTPQYKEVDMSLSSTLENGFDCQPQWNIGGIFTVYIIGQIVTFMFNLFFASLFFYKLNKVCIFYNLRLCDYAINDTLKYIY